MLATMLAQSYAKPQPHSTMRPAYVAEDGWPLEYAILDRVSDELAVGLARRGLDSRRRPRARPAAGRRVPRRVPRGRQARRDHRGGQRPPHTARAERASSRPRRPRPRCSRLPASRRTAASNVETVRPLRPRRGCSTSCASADETPPALADDPDRPVAIVFTSGTTGSPKGALVRQPPARVHHRRPTSATRGAPAAEA